MRSSDGRIIARYIVGGNFYTFTCRPYELAMFSAHPVGAIMTYFACTRPTAVHLVRKLRREAEAGQGFTRRPYPNV